MPQRDDFTLPAELGTLTSAEWDAKGRAAVLAWKPMAERYRRADTYIKGRKRQPMPLARIHADRWPVLAADVAANPTMPGHGWLPSVTRGHAARLKQMKEMQAAHGVLVLLRLDLSPLDALPLYSLELAQTARALIDERHAEVLHPGTPYTLGLQRANRTHSHVIVPFSGLLPQHVELVQAASCGAGGGCLLLEGRAHGVVIAPTDKDFEKVARYITRDPDARLYRPDDSDGYFDALEAMLRRRQDRSRKWARMAWKGSTPYPSF